MSLQQSIPYQEYTTAQRDALTNVVKGFKIFNIDEQIIETWDGLEWTSETIPDYIIVASQLKILNY